MAGTRPMMTKITGADEVMDDADAPQGRPLAG